MPVVPGMQRALHCRRPMALHLHNGLLQHPPNATQMGDGT